MLTPSDILTEKEVRELLRVSRTTIWKLRQNDPAFPKPFNKSPRMLRFYRGDVEAYIAGGSAEAHMDRGEEVWPDYTGIMRQR